MQVRAENRVSLDGGHDHNLPVKPSLQGSY